MNTRAALIGVTCAAGLAATAPGRAMDDDNDSRGEVRRDAFENLSLWSSLPIGQRLRLDLGALDDTNGERALRKPREEDMLLFFNTLALVYESDHFLVKAGKFTQNFGLLRNLTTGLYGGDFIWDYELSERWGASAGVKFPLAGGQNTLSLGTFIRDTSLFATPLSADGRSLRRRDGGAANTNEFSSLVLSLDGSDVAGVSGLKYHLAVARQSVRGGPDQPSGEQTGLTLGLAADIKLTDGLTMTPVLEVTQMAEDRSYESFDQRVATIGAAFVYDRWSLETFVARQKFKLVDGQRQPNTLFQISTGYALRDDVTLRVGWAAGRVDGEDSQRIRVGLEYAFGF